MPILKLHLENIGPFDKLELDLTDGKGKAHLGPHILAGVNGSGKTTVLRAIARCVANTVEDAEMRANPRKSHGFDMEGWQHLLAGKRRAAARFVVGSTFDEALQPTSAIDNLDGYDDDFLASDMEDPLEPDESLEAEDSDWDDMALDMGSRISENAAQALSAIQSLGCVATYAPNPGLRWLDQPAIGVDKSKTTNWLSFSKSADNESVQSYWVDCISREALAKVQGLPNGHEAESVKTLKRTVATVLGDDVEPIVNIQGRTRPSVRYRGTELNLSQLPSGLNATLGWVVDYLRRLDAYRFASHEQAKQRPGVILIDEIETHLHPQWQRRILDGIRAAFPNAQIIVTTHSPFVVSSCKDARVHVLKLNAKGKAYLAKSIDHPEGASVATTIRSVFDIASQYGPEIEAELRQWNELKKRDHVGKLSAKEKAELKTRTKELAKRGEELALLVHEPVLSDPLIEELIGAMSKRR